MKNHAPTTAIVATQHYGSLAVILSVDHNGNRRLIPTNAATLEAWRNDPSEIPPWLIPEDLTDPESFGPICDYLATNDPAALIF